MKVLKFGGTSVGSADNINKVIKILEHNSKNDDLVVVVSAIGGITDKLLKVANSAISKEPDFKEKFNVIKQIHLEITSELINDDYLEDVSAFIHSKLNNLEQLLDGLFLINELSPKTTDKLLSFGETLSSYIITEAIKSKGIEITLKNSQDLIITDSNHTNASVDFSSTTSNINEYFSSNKHAITLLPGFISKSKDGELTTLGRGGSDYTAAILASVLDAVELQIWTDVSGMFTTNPKIVRQALPIKNISYQEAVELSHFGAKVLYPPTVQPVLDKNIPIVIKNTLAPDDEVTCKRH
jgi:aspartokinase/homoserine dehydrogenase 1